MVSLVRRGSPVTARLEALATREELWEQFIPLLPSIGANNMLLVTTPQPSAWSVDLSDNDLTDVQLAHCPTLTTLDLSGNQLPAACVDQLLAWLDAQGRENGSLDLRSGNASPTAAGRASADHLAAKGWTIQVVEAPVATPTFTPLAGTYGVTQTVTLQCATAGATLYYTTNGSTPTTQSTPYTTPLTVATTTTIKALASHAWMANSAVGTAVYTLTPVATPTFDPPADTYTTTPAVTITCATQGATIYYTTNGSTPTTSSTVYTAPVEVAVTTTLKALAVHANEPNSAVGSAVYTIQVATPEFDPDAGTYATTQEVAITSDTAGATLYYTTTGLDPTAQDTKYTEPVAIVVSTVLKALAVHANMEDSEVGSATYTLQTGTPEFDPPAGTYGTTQEIAITSATPGATLYYTTDGTDPTAEDTAYTEPVEITVTTTLKALATHVDLVDSPIGTAVYTLTG